MYSVLRCCESVLEPRENMTHLYFSIICVDKSNEMYRPKHNIRMLKSNTVFSYETRLILFRPASQYYVSRCGLLLQTN